MATGQNRVELKGSERAAFPGGQDVGPADPKQHIEVSVLLRRGSKAGEFPSAAKVGAQLPRQRKYLTRDEFAKAHGASAADIQKIRGVAAEYPLKMVREDPASRTVKLVAVVQALIRAFGANLRRYQHIEE